jgi:predicted nucleic acid-binding protein
VKRFVLDASVALSWFIDRPTVPYATRIRQFLLQGASAAVPGIWAWEVANGFITAERRGVLTTGDTAEFLESLEVVLRSVETAYGSTSIRQIIGNARQFAVTAYDLAYLDLARELQFPIATLDRALAQAAVKAGVELLK